MGLLLVVVGSTQGFLMTRVDPGFSRVREGQSVDLLCQVGQSKVEGLWLRVEVGFGLRFMV